MVKKVVLTLALLVSNSSLADWYVGAEYSYGEVKMNSSTFSFPGTEFSISGDSDSQGYKILGGYRFNENLSVELSYADLGTYEVANSFIGIEEIPVTGALIPGVDAEFSGSFRSEVEASVFSASVVGILPVGSSLYLKATGGITFSSVDSKTDAIKKAYQVSRAYPDMLNRYQVHVMTVNAAQISESNNESKTKPMIGLGIGYEASDLINVEVLFNRYFDILQDSFDNNFDTYSLRLTHTF